MKARNFSAGLWLGLVGGLLLVPACNRQKPASNQEVVNVAPAPSPPAVTAAPAREEKPFPEPDFGKLKPAVAEIVKLVQSGTHTDVLRAYIIISTNTYDLSAQEIAYLGDIGVAPEIIVEMINKDKLGRQIAAALVAPVPAIATPAVPSPAPGSAEYQVFYETAPPMQPVEVVYAPAVEELPPVFYFDPPLAGDTAFAFETDLADYGTWFTVPEYGRCWRPNAVLLNPNWRPYCDAGRWVHTDCGWYWQSDYSWGWAAFHYGRWLQHGRNGWIWVPGKVWAPAWVSWRLGTEFCGWAPLPPAAQFKPGAGFSFQGRRVGISHEFGLTVNQYTFVPVAHFKDPDLLAQIIKRDQARAIYNQTHISNNYRTKNNRVIVSGLDSRSEANAKAQAVEAIIRDLPPKPAVLPDRVHRQGNDWVIYRKLAPNSSGLEFQGNNSKTHSSRPEFQGNNGNSPSSRPESQGNNGSSPSSRPEFQGIAEEVATADTKRNAAARILSDERAAAERAYTESKRQAVERAVAEAQTGAEDNSRKQAEAARQAEVAWQTDAGRQIEAARQAEVRRIADERAAANRIWLQEQTRRKAESEQQAEATRQAEAAQRLAAEQAAAERARAEEQTRRRADEERQAEEVRRAEARRAADERAAAERAQAEEQARRRADEERQAEARQAEARRQADERAAAERTRAEEHARREADRQAEAARQAEARRAAEAQAAADRARAEEARRQSEERSRRDAEERSKRDADEKTKDNKK